MIAGTPILLYHRVGPRDGSRMDRYTVSPERFLTQMAFLANDGWNVVALEDLLDQGKCPRGGKYLVITFDDGFASNRAHAWPLLARFGFRAATFIVTDQIGGTNVWDDAGMPRYPLLTRADLLAADSALMTFQSHGATHASLPGLDAPNLAREIRESKTTLEALTKRPVKFFAYAFGSWTVRDLNAVRAAGYLAACSCRSGRNGPRTDPYLLRRVEIREEDLGWRLRVKLSTGVNFG